MSKSVTPSMLTSWYDRSDFLAFAEPQSINSFKGSEQCVWLESKSLMMMMKYVNKVKVFFDHCHPSLMIQRNRED